MRGLCALCCSKQDKGDDSQNPPARPAQPRPEKNTQSAPSSVKKSSTTDVTPAKTIEETPIAEKPTQQKPARRDLWKEAFDSLDPSRQPYVTASGIKTTDAIKQVIGDTTEKYEQWRKGGLKIRRKDGDDIDIRDYAERILGAAMKASDVISTAVSFDPTGHASSAWMVISFGMSIVQNNLDRRDAIFEASEYLAETLSYYSLIDENYRNQGVGSDGDVDKTLLGVYTAILEFTVEVKKGRDENAAMRTFQSFLALTDQPLQTLKDDVESQSKHAKQWTELAANLGDRKKAAAHLAKTDEVLAGMKNLASKSLTAEEEGQLVWMSAAPYSDRQRALQKKRTADTGLWLLDSSEYNTWKNVPGSLLWLPGISGCGKSVLCSTVIKDLEEDCSLNPSKFLGYWYFQFSEEATKSVDAMVRSLIRQLSRSPLAPGVKSLWETHCHRGSQPDSKAVFNVFESLLAGATGEIYLVFDALDECPEDEEVEERGLLLSFLEDLLERQNEKIHILVTSRPENDIDQRLKSFPKIDLEEHLAEDVKTFVSLSLTQGRLKRWNAGIHDLILNELLNSKERRFRWTELQIMALEKCRDEDGIRKALKTIPRTLEATYRRILENIDPDDEEFARQILMIVCLSPVRLDVQVVANMAGLSFPEDVVKICTTSFLSLFEDNVQLAHFSVQEFLLVQEKSSQHHACQFTAVDGHSYLTEKAADILLEETEPLKEADAKTKISFTYAAKNWNTHLTAAGGIDALQPELQAKINRLFTESNVYFNWVRAADHGFSLDNEWSKILEECRPPLIRASLMGLVKVVDCLLVQGADPFQPFVNHQRYGYQEDPFTIAAGHGQLDVLHTLLDKSPPPGKDLVQSIVNAIRHGPAGNAKLESVLRSLWDRNLLRNQSSDVSDEMDEDVLGATIMNPPSGARIVEIFMGWEPRISLPITDEILLNAIWQKSILDAFLERYDARVSPTFLEKLEASPLMYMSRTTDGLALLAIKRPREFPMGTALFEKFANELDLETFKWLIQVRKSEFRVTERVLVYAADNKRSGGLFPLLWPLREPGIALSEQMLCNAVGSSHTQEFVGFMQKHIESDLDLNEEIVDKLLGNPYEGGTDDLKSLLRFLSPKFSISDELAWTICRNDEAVEIMSLLAGNTSFNFPITEKVLSCAAYNRVQGPDIIKYLAKLHQKPLPFTEETLIEAVQNPKKGKDILSIILQDVPPTLLTEKVFKEACENKDAMVLLLDQKQEDLPIEAMIIELGNAKAFHNQESRDVLQVLLERNLLNLDESVVEVLAANFFCLDLLLSWKPDLPITEKILMAAANDHRSVRLLMSAQESPLDITENVLISAAQGGGGLPVMQLIQDRQGSINITENVVKASLASGGTGATLVKWLLEPQSESFITAIFQDVWKDVNLIYDFHRHTLLKIFLAKTGSKITDSLLQDWPFDRDNEENHCIYNLIMLGDEFELPATEAAAEVFVERCDNQYIEQFMEGKQIPVTDRLIQAAKGNPIANQEDLMSFLEKKRG